MQTNFVFRYLFLYRFLKNQLLPLILNSLFYTHYFICVKFDIYNIEILFNLLIIEALLLFATK